MTDRYIPMFVFGTLRNQSTREMLGVFPEHVDAAVLPGFRKEGLNIIEDEGDEISETPGNYFLVTEDELKKLDHYEGVARNYYHRFLVNVKTSEGWKRAYVYQIIK